jgi:hypothetical protein
MFTFDLAPDGGAQYRVVATSRDVSLWERTGKGRSLAAIERDARMSQLEEIAHIAAQRRAGYVGSLADFRSTVDVTPIDVDAEREAERKRAEADGEDVDDESDPSGPTPRGR